MTDEKTPLNNEMLLYTTPDGAVRVDVQYEDESFWLSQKKMAEFRQIDELFQLVGMPAIDIHFCRGQAGAGRAGRRLFHRGHLLLALSRQIPRVSRYNDQQDCDAYLWRFR
jgi:hypothetical protein